MYAFCSSQDSNTKPPRLKQTLQTKQTITFIL